MATMGMTFEKALVIENYYARHGWPDFGSEPELLTRARAVIDRRAQEILAMAEMIEGGPDARTMPVGR